VSAAIQVFAVELCCPQQIRFSLSNLCCPQRIMFLLPNLCHPQRIRGSPPHSCCLQRITGSVSNGVVGSESDVRCRFVLSAANEGYPSKFVLSAANQGFAAELCCWQRIRCSLSNCVVRSELGVCCRNYVVGRESAVRCCFCVVRVELGVPF
jgi:hypothetical protein